MFHIFHKWKYYDEVQRVYPWKNCSTAEYHNHNAHEDLTFQVRECTKCGKKEQRYPARIYNWVTHISQRK